MRMSMSRSSTAAMRLARIGRTCTPVQVHQASLFYGVASTELGIGAVQRSGPEAGLQEQARRLEIPAYQDDILNRRFLATGRS
jgi:hypothetical protein